MLLHPIPSFSLVCMRRWVLQPKILMTVFFVCVCFRHSDILSGRSHAQTSCVIRKGLYLHNSNTHKRNTFQYNLTVPPGGQTVLLPQCHRMFFLLSPFICCFFFSSDTLEMSSKSNIFIYKAVWCILREHGVSSRTRKKKGRNVQMYSGSFAEVLWHDKECKKNSVFFIKEYFYCYFVVKRRECISLHCMSWESSGRFDHLIQQMTKC